MDLEKEFDGINVGDKFSSFDQFSAKILSVQDATCVQLYVRDARTIDAAKKRMPKLAAKTNPELRYHSLQYNCVFGGKLHKSISKNPTVKAQ